MVGYARSIEEATFLEPHANLILVASELGGQSTLDLVRGIHAEQPDKKIIIVGIANEPDLITRYIEAGAVGYVLAEESMSKLVEKIRAVESERALVSPRVTLHLMRRLAQLAQQPLAAGWQVDPVPVLRPAAAECGPPGGAAGNGAEHSPLYGPAQRIPAPCR